MLSHGHEGVSITELKGHTLLVAPLDWGLGHASRCIELIHFLKRQNVVILGITPSTAALLNNIFPDLKSVEIPALGFFINPHLKFGFSAWIQLPKFIKILFSELIWVRRFKARCPELSCIISDNRYGIRHSKVLSIMITHQLNMQGRGLIQAVNFIHKIGCKPFNQVWIPDYESPKQALAGLLSRADDFHRTQFYIGPLSQLNLECAGTFEKHDIVILLSGPEPLRSRWANSLVARLISIYSSLQLALISPVPLYITCPHPAFTIRQYILPKPQVLTNLILNSKCVITRAGYSTLMDLNRLNKPKALLIPTPQQREQEYLAHYWQQQGWANHITESEWNTKPAQELKALIF
jgi:hypothetical protein